MALAPERTGIGIHRHFTTPGIHPYDEIEWETRDARIVNFRDGSVAFEQKEVEFPASWSENARNIVSQKYFRGQLDSSERESSLRQVIDRVVDTIAQWGELDGYFVDGEEVEAFRDELRSHLVNQRAAFNSPVWFNIGVEGERQQASACFILSVDDQMSSILNWYVEEGVIFKGGSGAGVNLSKIRSSKELLKGGGTASGPVSFMRGADASAGTIKSGGKTRRAAKMVILDVEHPDVETFIWCKAVEERKARVLRDAGFDMGLDGTDIHSIQYQNANNSVRVSDDFMQAVIDDAQWDLKAVTDGSVVSSLPARELLTQIATAAWECADPGVQFDTTINHWHTASNTAPIRASNPCSEYMHIDNSACNLASINLLKFLSPAGDFDVEGFKSAVQVLITAQEILVGRADYPTEKIAENTRKFRQLGLGYANLGALLMGLGLPYDSDKGRAIAATITALMTGHAYATSAGIAQRMGPFSGYFENREPMNRVLRQHRDAVSRIDEELVPPDLLSAAQRDWDKAVEAGQLYGVRNAQASVLAPTGTIGFMMDCDTTGIEPDLSLVKHKTLVGGGSMKIVNKTVTRALEALGYGAEARQAIVAHIDEKGTAIGAPGLAAEHLGVFACAMGDNVIHYMGHVRMMGAVQPFLSGAISKTVNLPEQASVADIEDLLVESWKLGLKAVAVYRDNCKVSQPLSVAKKVETADSPSAVGLPAGTDNPTQIVEKIVEKVKEKSPQRERMPRARRSKTFSFRVAECHGYVTVGEYDDGRPGELFLKVAKQGSTLAGIMDAFAISVSHGLQYGVPLKAFVEMFTSMKFEPNGITDDPDVRMASSLVDYIFRRLALEYLPYEERLSMGVLGTRERLQPTLPGVDEQAIVSVTGSDVVADPPDHAFSQQQGIENTSQGGRGESTPVESQHIPLIVDLTETSSGRVSDAPMCFQCGNTMLRAGSCYACQACGATSGCS